MIWIIMFALVAIIAGFSAMFFSYRSIGRGAGEIKKAAEQIRIPESFGR